MTLLEFSEKTNMDLKGTLARFANMEALVKRFLNKFPDDRSFGELQAAMQEKNYENILRAAHTLKGVAGNLGLTGLFEINQKIVEAVRNQEYDHLDEYFAQDKKEYDTVIECLSSLE
jgi:HPt (histidine-containing phosphotransfer) domain-containing protein